MSRHFVKLHHHPSTSFLQRETFTHGLEAWIPHTFLSTHSFFRLNLQHFLSLCSLRAKASGRKLSVHWQIHTASSVHMTCCHNSNSINRSIKQGAEVCFKKIRITTCTATFRAASSDIKNGSAALEYPSPQSQFHRWNKWDNSTFTLHHPGKSLSVCTPLVGASHRSFSPGN